jgi:hypothetical protein
MHHFGADDIENEYIFAAISLRKTTFAREKRAVIGHASQIYPPLADARQLGSGTHQWNTFYYLKILRQKGYVQKNGIHYALTEKTRTNFALFLDAYKRRISRPFTWRYFCRVTVFVNWLPREDKRDLALYCESVPK